MAKKQMKRRTFEGLPVVDAEKSLTLHVLPNDVARSSSKDPSNCAAAHAGQRELGKDVRVFLTRTYVMDDKNKRWVRFFTPESVSREIVSFDRGSAFVPGEYTFKPASPSNRLGIPKGYNNSEREKHDNKGIRKKIHTTALVRERGKYDPSKRMSKRSKKEN